MKCRFKTGQHVYTKFHLICEGCLIERGTECIVKGHSLLGNTYDIEVANDPKAWMLDVEESALAASLDEVAEEVPY